MKKKLISCACLLCAGLMFTNVEAKAMPMPEPVAVHASSTDWDKVLDSYEKYVNQHIAVYKKVQAGDMNAYNEMASLMEKYQKLAEQLEEAQDEMTEAQVARYLKITQKLASAL